MTEKSVTERFEEFSALQTSINIATYGAIVDIYVLFLRNADHFDEESNKYLKSLSDKIDSVSLKLDKMIEL